MMTDHIAFAQLCSAARREASQALCMTLCTLALVLSASAEASASVPSGKEIALHNFVNPPHAVFPAAGVSHVSASAQESAPVPNAQEVVLHNFVSPPRGAYPAWGVIRDSAGNLYGTTNGAYSDIGGGGTNDAGVVFKVDPS